VGASIFDYFYGGHCRTHQANDVRRACATFQVSVAEADGRVVGFTAVDLKAESVEGEIYMVAVDPEAQGAGVGTRLTLAAVEQLREAGKRAVVVGTGGDPGHAAARATYHKAGFTPPERVLLPAPRRHRLDVAENIFNRQLAEGYPTCTTPASASRPRASSPTPLVAASHWSSASERAGSPCRCTAAASRSMGSTSRGTWWRSSGPNLGRTPSP
jgi:N-acetylglutamate synthase-like GNAT family acetyltransferase